MNGNIYIEEIEKYINFFKVQIEDEKKELIQSQNNFSSIFNSFSHQPPSSSVINSLFKDEESNVFIFDKNEEKRKQLAKQRKAEYNAYLEKKEAELLTKRRVIQEKKSVSPKSILESVDYEQVLAKRKEEEAKFRNVNIGDILYSSKPILNETVRKTDSNYMPSDVSTLHRENLTPVNMPGSTIEPAKHTKFSMAVDKRKSVDLESVDTHLIEERIAKYLQEQKQQMLLEFEKELRRDIQMSKEIQDLKKTIAASKSNSAQSSPIRTTSKTDDLIKFGRTGGGGEPVKDSLGNLLTLRGAKREGSTDYNNIMAFPSMQQQPIKDRMALYREELQRQIEEKKRLEALERAKAHELEEKIAQRIEEQRLTMQQEYEKELAKNNKIKEEFQRQQERIRKLEEFQRKDFEERKKKMMEVKPTEPKIIPPTDVQERSLSPPIPAVRTKVLLENAIPPVTKTEVKPEKVFSSIAEIRRKIMQEQKPKTDFKNTYEVMNRRTVQDISDDDDDDDDLFRSSFQSSN